MLLESLPRAPTSLSFNMTQVSFTLFRVLWSHSDAKNLW